MTATDVVDLLLPDADTGTQERARQLVTFARLAAGEASAPRAASTDTLPACARSEFDWLEDHDRVGALETLLVEVFERVLAPDSFVSLPPVRSSWRAAWSVLEHMRELGADVPEVPHPETSALAAATQWIEFGRRLAAPDDAGRWQAWGAVHSAVFHGPQVAERAWRELLADNTSWAVRCRAVAGVAESLLERGAVRAARDFLEDHLGEVACEERPIRLLAWSQALLGEVDAASHLARELAPARRVPAQLSALRTNRRSSLEIFAGRAAPGPVETGPVETGPAAPGRVGAATCDPLFGAAIERRGDAGATLVAVEYLSGCGLALPLFIDAAPGIRERVDARLRKRRDAVRERGEPEHELVTGAAPVRRWRDGDVSPRGALHSGTRALALAPIFDVDDRDLLVGWLRLECEHDLLPSTGRLRCAALEWAGRASAARAGSSPEEAPAVEDDVADPRRTLFDDWLERTGRKLGSRRWWVFDSRAGALREIGSGGGALDDWRSARGRARSLQRAHLAAGCIRFSEPASALSVHAAAASGCAVPIALGQRVLGVFAIESTRRGDFAGDDGRQLEADIARLAPAFHGAQFRAWCRTALGRDVLPSIERATATPLAQLIEMAHSREPVVLSGPAGVGKEVIARWFQFEVGGVPWVWHACGSLEPEAEVARLFGEEAVCADGAGGLCVLDGLERLTAAAQAQLLRQLDDTGSAPRWVLLSRHKPVDAVERGLLRADLGSRLARAHIALLPLRRTRERIAGLLSLFLRRFAQRERMSAPRLDPEAQALVWRQPWEDNVRALENVAYRLVVRAAAGGACSEAESVDARQVSEALRELDLPVLARLPSRHPEREDVCGALESTRRGTGALNKRRAAQYLGWDPDTLVARMTDLGLEDRGPSSDPGSGGGAGPK